MTDMRLSVRRWRPVIKGIGLASFADLHALLKNMPVLPKLPRLFLTLHKIQVGVNFVVHGFLPSIPYISFLISEYYEKPPLIRNRTKGLTSVFRIYSIKRAGNICQEFHSARAKNRPLWLPAKMLEGRTKRICPVLPSNVPINSQTSISTQR